jgi:hypothetical protein
MSIKVQNGKGEPNLSPESDAGSTLLSSYPAHNLAPATTTRKSVAAASVIHPDLAIDQRNDSPKQPDKAHVKEDIPAKSQPLPFVKTWTFDIFINATYLTIVSALLVFAAIAGRLHGRAIGKPQHYTVLKDVSNKVCPHNLPCRVSINCIPDSNFVPYHICCNHRKTGQKDSLVQIRKRLLTWIAGTDYRQPNFGKHDWYPI